MLFLFTGFEGTFIKNQNGLIGFNVCKANLKNVLDEKLKPSD
jgi:hypothetical protein